RCAFAHRLALLDHDAHDAARHQGSNDAAGAQLVLTALALERERIGDVDVNDRVGEADLMHGAVAVVHQRQLRSVLEAKRSQIRPGVDDVGDEPAIGHADAVRTSVTLDFDWNFLAAMPGDESHERSLSASRRPACFHAELSCCGSRICCDSSNARIAAAAMAAST